MVLADEVLIELDRLRSQGVPCCMATVVRVEAPTSGKPGDKAVITADGKMVGWIGGSCSEPSVRREALSALADNTPRLVRITPVDAAVEARFGEVVLGTSCPSGGTIEIFLEPHIARPQLVAVGRSPAAHTILRLAALVGFRTCAVHLGATEEDFPEADQVASSLELGGCGIGQDSWIVVATMGHYDEEALEAVLSLQAGASSPAYVGLIASRRRRNAVAQALRGRGWSGDALASIVNPAGRMLGDTQEEIALSVMADIVARRHRRARRESHADEVSPGGAPQPIFATDPTCGMAVEIATAQYRSGGQYFCGPGCLEAYEVAHTRG